MKLNSSRAGELITDVSQYQYFAPTSLFNIKIEYDEELGSLLNQAQLLIGKLDGACLYLPSKDLFISTYVQKEATISSQIEGTQASLTDVLQANTSHKKDVIDIVNYTKALHQGLELLDKYPICTRLYKELHKTLLENVRGQEKNPGEIRTSQNWVGPKNSTLSTATYIPPKQDQMVKDLSDLDKYINKDNIINPLIDIALIHYQFETIHPFLDGNGRLGRLIIPLYLKTNNLMQNPLLYLSLYFKENKQEYYDKLMDVRINGKYEEWIKFFLKGIIEASKDAIKTIDLINNLKNDLINTINKNQLLIKYKDQILEFIFNNPYFTSVEMSNYLDVSNPTVTNIIDKLLEFSIVSKKDNKQRNSTYCFAKYVNILTPGTELN